MPVDFGLLQTKQPVGGVVATLPMVPQTNSLDSLAGGIMSGLQQGQQIKASRQNMAVQQQQMDQSAQAFPLQQQERQQTNEMNQMKIDSAKTQQVDIAEQRKASQQSYQAYLDVVKKQDPVQWIKIQKDESEVKKNFVDAADKMEDTKGKGVNNYYSIAEAGGNMASTAVQNGKNPAEQEAIYQQQLQYLPDSLRAVYPKTLKGNEGLLIKIGTDAHLDLLEKSQNDPKNTTTNQKELRQIGILEKKAKETGGLTSIDRTELDGLKQAQAAKDQKLTVNPLDSKLAEVDTGRLKTYHDASDKAPDIAQKVQMAKAILQRPGMATKVGPTIDLSHLNQLSPDVQELGSLLNDLALTAKGLSGMPSNTFSEADRNFVAKIAGTTAFNIKSLNGTLDRMSELSKQAVIKTYNEEEKIRKQSGNYKEWKAQNPAPDLSAWEEKKQNKASTQFEEGKVYQDAGGNKAQYINGQWKEI